MPPNKPRIRQRFGPNQDYLLAVQANTDAPFRAAYGTLMSSWEKVANTLNSCSAFKMHHLKGPIAKNRFERLVERHREWVQSGSVPDDAPSQDVAFMTIMNELVPKLNAAEAEQLPILGKRGRPRKIRSGDAVSVPKEKRHSTESTEPASTGSTATLRSVLAMDTPIVGRQRFTPDDDLMLIQFVKESLPFRAKFGSICSAWNDVAAKLDACPEFSKDSVKGPIVRYRFENLVAKHRERVKRNNGHVVGPKGAPAGELEVIMTELVALQDGEDAESAAQLAQRVMYPTPIAPSPVPTQSFILPAPVAATIDTSDASSFAGLKVLLQEMVNQQARSMEQMLQLHQELYDQEREERRLEGQRRQRELQLEREEREKDRQALTSTVMSVMKAFLEQNSRD
ncbi:hypothetical protein JM18_003816 [Phytophthora kernoviae]|uniref:Myb-like domain-containing protein n=2 Tax=Phytophthora kernoviae TaxID=325452 RepID=A0A921VAR4_9STRA|nr:hypothetical protein G195_005069 [Phytophthora kernoviae 00238/432]KAG2527331.1 hypothetical protein JM18_003816 [Phytophthora kernoviae]